TTVLLEAATFNNVSIRRTASRLKLRSEASARFEKGLPPQLAEVAARRAAQPLVVGAPQHAPQGPQRSPMAVL
ncbi:MAG: hypothetical protein K6T17_05170, partial [Fimbriimonadales bacterium]|nr:hypothetical protein [Fimbriimonadales bacterium]